MSNYLFLIFIFLNIGFIITMIFIERKKPQIIVAWTTIMVFLPGIGFFLYILIGGGLSITTKLRIKRKKLYSKDYDGLVTKYQKNQKEYKQLANNINSLSKYNFALSNSKLFDNNKVDFFSNGKDKIKSLKQDLLVAKHSINMEYYIFADDNVGKEIMSILCKKAKEGIKVRLIYDSVGSLRSPRRFFHKLKIAGGNVAEFFPPFLYIRLINFKLNNRNHRKIVVIDGKIAYTGGINLRDDHMGENKKLSPWRDTHIKITGEAVHAFQNAFFNDWRFCKKDKTDVKTLIDEGYFPNIPARGNSYVQTITSGPEDNEQIIKNALVKAILSAKKRIVLQSPYFIPDEVFFEALKTAKLSGIDVIIMLPKIPDKKIVYMATLSYAKDLLYYGVKIMLFNGFLHAKALVIDDDIISVGTCNADNRSFALNFEINSFIFDKEAVKEYEKILKLDFKNSCLVEKEYFEKKPLYSKMMQAIFRLFSPLL